MALRSILILLIISTQWLLAKPPSLSPRDAKGEIEEILRSHVSYQKLTPDLIQRAIANFVDELDPGKTYFIESDLEAWLHPDADLLSTTLEQYHETRFDTFKQIHQAMLSAIERRNTLEQALENTPLPTDVEPSEFKDLTWATNSEALQNRLSRIQALQLQTAEKLNPDTKELFAQRLKKRRLNREAELVGGSPLEQEQLTLSYILKAMSAALDSQTIYFTPAEANQFMIQVQQRLFGIGAQLRDDLSGFTIVRLIEGSPAHASNKLKIGDRIIAVNGEPVVGLDIIEAVELIRGPQGSVVTLTLMRDEEEKIDVEIIRSEVVLKETRLESRCEPYGDGVIAVLHLFSFYQDQNNSSATDVATALQEISKEHLLKGIILDLRNNSGGLLPQAVAVTGLFIPKGVVVSIKDNSGHIQHLWNLNEENQWDGPLIVLTNRASASAAEIVAQTLQDYGRALVIGDTETFGKGTFQTFTLESSHFGKINPKGEFKVTRGRYYTVSGKSPQLVGVQADIAVPSPLAHTEYGERFSKFPVDTDQIPSNLESVLKMDLVHLDALKKNSALRMKQNKNYQAFIQLLEKNDDQSLMEAYQLFEQQDLQMEETLKIMQDFIFLSHITKGQLPQ